MCIRTKSGASYFTLVELLVVIAIISILAAMLMPALEQAVGQAKTVSCASNMKQIGIVLSFYQEDNEGYFPRTYKYDDKSGVPYNDSQMWYSLLPPYAPTRVSNTYWRDISNGQHFPGGIWNCDVGEHSDKTSNVYIFLKAANQGVSFIKSSRIDTIDATNRGPSFTPFIGETFINNQLYYAEPSFVKYYHNGAGNWLFCDGHVETILKFHTDNRWDIDYVHFLIGAGKP